MPGGIEPSENEAATEDPSLEDSESAPPEEPTFEDPSAASSADGADEAIPTFEEPEPTFEEPEPTFENTASEGSEDGDAAGEGASTTGTGDPSELSGDLSAEEIESIFDEQIGTFDGMILAEQRNAERQANSTLAGGSGNETTATVAEAAGVGTFADYSGETGGAPGGTFKSGEVFNGQVIDESEIPSDIPPPQDDDVVARQIREAAMSEPDPIQREILWDEYRRYKGL